MTRKRVDSGRTPRTTSLTVDLPERAARLPDQRRSCPICGGEIVDTRHDGTTERIVPCGHRAPDSTTRADGVGYYLVKSDANGSSASVYHLPDPEKPDVSQCNRAVVTWHRRGEQYIEQRGLELCEWCAGTVSITGRGDHSLHDSLQEATPDDLGLGDNGSLRTDGGPDTDDETESDNEDDEWNPEPAQLREGESGDDTHARRNAEQLRIIERELDDADDAADESGGEGQ